MTDSPYRDYLEACKGELDAAWGHLDYSTHSVKHLSEDTATWSPEDFEKAEAFTSRFARVVDLLVHRVFRAIDRFELNEPGTLLDVANRAEARGLIPSVDWLRELKDVRNRIAHDYAAHQLSDIFAFCRGELGKLEETIGKVREYMEQLL